MYVSITTETGFWGHEGAQAVDDPFLVNQWAANTIIRAGGML